ncbi:MAG: phosphomannomutase/phosphoglucomutase [Candidatus Caldarchaeum sp.]|uniref:Phosphomannomutase/phosphoglucomutase n=1 Tax=Caldiarchaeum subterraneum TaxID=311458 RepID=A0A7C5QMZ2_CALS0
MKPSPHIFRAYDVRGVYGKDLDEEVAYRIGRAFGKIAGGKIIVGRDVRLSGKQLSTALIEGLNDSGADVLDAGVCTTPACYFGARHFNASGGVMVTASHNPKEWNGFKMFLGDGETVSEGAGMEEIRDMVINEKYGPVARKGSTSQVNLLEVYGNYLSKRFPRMPGLRMAVDLSDGSAALVAPQVLRSLEIDFKVLNDIPDGFFRGHDPEPTDKNIEPLRRLVVEQGFDMGVAFDGDADRAVFVDDRGRLLNGDVAMAVLLKTYNTRGVIVYDVNSSTALKEVAERLGFTPVEWKVGRAFLHRKVRELGAVLGGEKSNHLYFGELGGDDDALYAALKMAELLHTTRQPLSRHVDEIPSYPTTPILVYDCPDSIKFKVVEKIGKRLGQMGFRISSLDGVKAYVDEGWVLIRASNTMPQIKMSVEAKTVESLEKLKSLGERLILEEVAAKPEA